MFSKMSVRVQPFAPQSEYAGVPDALIVLASLIICDHVFGALDTRLLEDVDVVPEGRLVGRLEEERVELAVDLAQVLPCR